MAKRELSAFEKAFAAARKEQGAGGTFEYNGKKYSTDTAEDKAKSRRKQDEDDAVERLRGMTPRMKARDIEAEEPSLPKIKSRGLAANESKAPPLTSRFPKSDTVSGGRGMFQNQGQMKKGGSVKKYRAGGSVSSASKRADGIAKKGKTKGRIC